MLRPSALREAVAGDLEEIWRNGRTTRLGFYRIAAASILTCWIDALCQRIGRVPEMRRREHTGDGQMTTFFQDVAYGVRMMRRAPGFTAAAVLTIALGIGVNTATFGIVNVISLKPLSYAQPERVAFVLGWNQQRQQRIFNLPLADALDIRDQARTLDAVAAYTYWSANLTGSDRPERLQAYRVTADTFALLGVSASIGRALTVDDARPDSPFVVVLSDGLWRRRFGADPAILGRPVTLDGVPHTVVGVMPPRFEFPVFNFKGEAWTPLKTDARAGATRAASPSIVAIARLKPGVSYQAAQADLDAVMRRLEVDYPPTNRGLGVQLIEMRRLGEAEGAPLALVLMAAVGFVLLLACANVANLLLARAVGRERELAVRAALGAGRGRLVRQLLTESLLLAAGGAALGVGFAWWALRALRAILPEGLTTTMPNVAELGIDRVTFGFAAAAAVACAALFGAGPALRMARADLQGSLKSGGTGASAGPRHQRFRAALMVGEVAISLIMLVAAGLLVRTFDRLRHVDAGFAPDRVLSLMVALPAYRYADEPAQQRFFEAALDQVSQVPGVTSAAFVNVLPFSTYNDGSRFVVDGPAPPEPGREASTDYRAITPEYFRTLAIPIIGGRPFDSRDRGTTEPVAIVSRAFARRAFGDGDPLGKRVRLGRRDSRAPWLTIVGLVGDVRHSEITEQPQPTLYRPFAQAPQDRMMLAARVSGNGDALMEAVRGAIAAVDPIQPVYHVATLSRLVEAALLPSAAAMSMMTLFGALALLLATIGIYGVVSYAVSQQTRELGVRLALGASPRDVLRLVLRRGLVLVFAGAALGIVGALGVTRLMAGILYGVTPADVTTYATVAGVLMLVGVAACYVPARRAMRVDPVVVLRME